MTHRGDEDARALLVVGGRGLRSLVLSIGGENRLGPVGIMRDEALDEEGGLSEQAPPAGWSTDTAAAGSLREYVAEGIYLEATQQELEQERKRVAVIPEALRIQIFDAMQHARLQSIFAVEDGLDFTWQRAFFREGALAEVLGAHLDLGTAVFEVFENHFDPDPRCATAERRCPYCHQKIIDLRFTQCENCGGPL